MKIRKKHILSRSGVGYRVILDDNQSQMQIIWLTKRPLTINRKKREIQNALNSRYLQLEMVKEDSTSVTYMCPKHFQKLVLGIIKKS